MTPQKIHRSHEHWRLDPEQLCARLSLLQEQRGLASPGREREPRFNLRPNYPPHDIDYIEEFRFIMIVILIAYLIWQQYNTIQNV